MGREVRRVPANWEHPKDGNGNYIPMHKRFPYSEDEIKDGLAEGWMRGGPPNYGIPTMPQWEEHERTHCQMYEDTSEGTPISPVFSTPEELARWLADNGASSFGKMTATYEQWLHIAKGGWAPSLVINIPSGEMKSGVEFAKHTEQKG